MPAPYLLKINLLIVLIFLNKFSIAQSKVDKKILEYKMDLNINELDNYDGFSILDSSINKSRLVFLGESSHTTKEYSLVKYKLIKYLVEKHNFKVVLFESGIADCFYGNKLKSKKDSTWLLRHSIFPIWWSKITSSLMNYIKKNDVTLAGFDYQRSSNFNSEFLKLDLKLDTGLTSEIYKLDTLFTIFTNVTKMPMDSTNLDKYHNYRSRLNEMYNKLVININNNKDKLDPIDVAYYRRIISNKLFFINNYSKIENIYRYRDSVMGSNLLWLCDSIYKNEKIIIWGANDHIAKHKSNLSRDFYAASVLPERIKKESYFIGLFAYSGQMYSYPSNFDIKTPKKNSLEDRIHKLGGDKDVFFDLKHNSQNRNFSWINKKAKTYHWGILDDTIVPSDFYDGIILINKVTLIRNFKKE